jgi:hypothetical protein
MLQFLALATTILPSLSIATPQGRARTTSAGMFSSSLTGHFPNLQQTVKNKQVVQACTSTEVAFSHQRKISERYLFVTAILITVSLNWSNILALAPLARYILVSIARLLWL